MTVFIQWSSADFSSQEADKLLTFIDLLTQQEHFITATSVARLTTQSADDKVMNRLCSKHQHSLTYKINSHSDTN